MSSYILLLKLDEPAVIGVGRLGRKRFPAGYYAYVGSAVRNRDARLMRHLRTSKKKRWHVDYLREKAEIRGIYLCGIEECALNELLAKVPGCEVPVPGFGSSDCASCESHLAYFHEEPDLSMMGL